MADESQSRTSKDRSPNFPFISLGRALERARQFYKHEKRGAAPFKVAAQHWAYSPSSSGALQTAAALKQYGLLADVDAGKDRKVRLTDLALRIVLDTREDSSERDQLKRQAAMTPPVAAEIYNKYPDGLPSEGTLNHYLVLDRSFNPQTAVKVVRILKENEGFTSGVGDGTISPEMQIDGDSEAVQTVTQDQQTRARIGDSLVERQGSRRFTAPMSPIQMTTSVGSLAAGGNCTLTIVASGGGHVTQEALTKLIKFVELVKDGFPKAVETGATQTVSTPDEAPVQFKVKG